MNDSEGYYCYYGPEVQARGNRLEDATYVCGHCETGMLKSAWKLAGGHCFVCEEKLCTNCVSRIPTFGCEAVKRRLDRAINEQYRREQNAKIFGI